MGPYGRKDTRTNLAFHEKTGLDTVDYRQLKDQIEDLVREGKLTDWVV